MSIFQRSANKIIVKRAVLMWNWILCRSFEAWTEYVREKSLGSLLEIRMLYWKAQQIFIFWRSRVQLSPKLRKLILKFSNKNDIIAQRKSFRKWNLVRKIESACRCQSETFKSKALGFTMLRIIRFNMLKKSMFYLWQDETAFQLKLDWAFEFRCKPQSGGKQEGRQDCLN